MEKTQVTLTAEIIKAGTGCTDALAAKWLTPLAYASARYNINTKPRLAAFLAQIGHETARLVYVREIWGPTPAQRRYEGRADLGNVEPGDGKRFMGRGLIQITGRANYRALTKVLRAVMREVPNFEADPLPLEEPRWAALSAAWYWDSRDLNALADDGTEESFVKITRRINGGLNGYADRKALWEAGKKALGALV